MVSRFSVISKRSERTQDRAQSDLLHPFELIQAEWSRHNIGSSQPHSKRLRLCNGITPGCNCCNCCNCLSWTGLPISMKLMFDVSVSTTRHDKTRHDKQWVEKFLSTPHHHWCRRCNNRRTTMWMNATSTSGADNGVSIELVSGFFFLFVMRPHSRP